MRHECEFMDTLTSKHAQIEHYMTFLDIIDVFHDRFIVFDKNMSKTIKIPHEFTNITLSGSHTERWAA